MVMRPGFATGRPALLVKTPNIRRQAMQRRAAIICAFLALALVSGLVGSLTRPQVHLSSQPATGPFSYFPS